MPELDTISPVGAPSKKRIAKAAAVALLVAVVVLFTAVLPAEYGIDPLGVGALMGLTELSEATANPVDAGTGAAPVAATANKSETRIYKVDTQDIVLAPGKGTEIKYHMQKGSAMVYSWKADGGIVQFEFHGEPDRKPTSDYYESYELDNKVGKNQSFGSFTAPTTGIHGWFWENKTQSEVKVRLTVAGYFDWAKQYVEGGVKDLPLQEVK